MPTQQLSRDVCHSGQSCVCSQCSIADHAQKLKHSHVMWLETTIRDRYIGQSYWDTHYGAKSCNGTEKYSTLVWKRENKNNPLNTFAREIFFTYYHICVTLSPVQRLTFSCTQPKLILSIEYMKGWTSESIKSVMANLDRHINQSIKSGTHENFDWGATWFQMSNFLCAKPNAQITIIY